MRHCKGPGTCFHEALQRPMATCGAKFVVFQFFQMSSWRPEAAEGHAENYSTAASGKGPIVKRLLKQVRSQQPCFTLFIHAEIARKILRAAPALIKCKNILTLSISLSTLLHLSFLRCIFLALQSNNVFPEFTFLQFLTTQNNSLRRLATTNVRVELLRFT